MTVTVETIPTGKGMAKRKFRPSAAAEEARNIRKAVAAKAYIDAGLSGFDRDPRKSEAPSPRPH